MKKLITKFHNTGTCEVDVNKAIKAWSDKFSISQWGEEYTLIKQSKGNNCAKVRISNEQANDIISKGKLLPIKSSLFNSGKTYKSEFNIVSEIKRLNKIKEEKIGETRVLTNIINEYESALNLKQEA